MDNEKARLLINAIVQGDRAAEQEFYAGYQHEVEFLVRLRIGRNNPDLPDVCQTVFIDIFKRIRAGDFDSRMGSPGAFVQLSIKFKVLDYLKSRQYQEHKTHMALNEKSAANPEESTDQLAIHHEESTLVESALSTLPDPYRTVLVLHFFNQLKISEIASELGLSEQKVSNYKSYALTLLARKLHKSKTAGKIHR